MIFLTTQVNQLNDGFLIIDETETDIVNLTARFAFLSNTEISGI